MFTKVVLLALASSVSCFNKEVDEKYHKLPHDEFIKYFNSQNFSYKITHYDGIEKKAVSCATRMVMPAPVPVPIHSTNKYSLRNYVPAEFDGRRDWEHCFNYPLDQGECGACWAITTATVATIRSCLQRLPYPRHDNTQGYNEWLSYGLSPLDLVCCKDCYSVSYCGEGSTEKAALFWMSNGLVTSLCKPSLGEINTSSCKEECVNDTIYYNADKYFGESVTVLVEDDHEIRREIATKGPVVATFVMFDDFKDYKEGIYEHTHGDVTGLHSVPVIGYGVENGVPYWLALNTWGLEWGEQSTFKVKRFDESLQFETQMLSLNPRFQ